MSAILRRLALALAAMLPEGVPAQSVPLQPGRYEVLATSTISVARGTEKGKTERASRCIRSADLADPEAVFNNRFLADFRPDGTCRLGNVVIAGGKVAYSADCKYSTVQVEGTATGTAYAVVRKARNKGPGPSVETRIDARRMGACG